jgi:hypothetical protein
MTGVRPGVRKGVCTLAEWPAGPECGAALDLQRQPAVISGGRFVSGMGCSLRVDKLQELVKVVGCMIAAAV